MFRDPDGGKFRSYYLSAALVAAASADWKWEPNSDEIAWQWTERAAGLCRSRNIPLTVVVIPEAFQVDDRMYEQWLPLADMRRCTGACRDAALSFVRRARANSLDVVDLHDELQGTRGTYLNLDGHWSAAGVDLVARVLAKHMQEK
jgi:16S rRNA G1207 methylase RsmC